jgi:hypothetical protein
MLFIKLLTAPLAVHYIMIRHGSCSYRKISGVEIRIGLKSMVAIKIKSTVYNSIT